MVKKAWEHLSHDVDTRWTYVGGEAVPDYKYVGNKPESKFLTGQVE